MVFALERTAHALHLLSLKKISTGYRVVHYDERLLNKSAQQVTQLQDLFSTRQGPGSEVIVGLNDADLIIRHINIDSPSRLSKIYKRTKAILAQDLSLPDYSWDAYPLKSYQGRGCYLLCVAYPLEKILFLQELLKLTRMHLQAVEPSICALARLSLILFKLPGVLFVLQENNQFILMLVQQGEVFALRQLEHIEHLEENIAALPIKPEKIIYMHDEKLSIDIFEYIEAQRYALPIESLRLWAPIGLALRQLK